VQTGLHGSFLGRLSPAFPSVNLNLSVFYPVRPDLAVLQLLGMAGLLCAGLGVTVLRAGGRRVGLAASTAGVLVLALTVGLLGGARRDAQGAVVVPLLDTVATQQPLPYPPVCGSGVPVVCVHPAYRAKLSVLEDAVHRLAAPLLGTPGLPARVEEAPVSRPGDVVVRGTPPVLRMPPVFIQGDTLSPDVYANLVRTTVALGLVQGVDQSVAHVGEAQRAVALYLVRQAGGTADTRLLPADAAARSAAARLAALPDGARHSWLVANIGRIRNDTIPLTELP
jgi:hypothetical protein